MELVFYFFVIALVSVASFWVLGFSYGLLRSPKIYFPMLLAVKMAVAAVLGGFLFMVGGVVLSTMIFNAEMEKRRDYRMWSTILVGLSISIACSVIIYFSIFYFAFQIFD